VGKSQPPMHVLSGPGPARATWALLPLLIGPALGEALGEHSLAVARTGSVLAWGTWALVLVAVLLPRTVSLTALRVVAPAALVVANWAALAGERGAGDLVAVAGAAIAVVAAFAPTTGEVFTNGSAYGDEARMPLRVPTPLVLGPVPLAWVATVTPPVAGPLLLAAEQWVIGAVVVVVGVPIAAAAARALHGLSRRWAVLVPAGLVLHDQQALVEPVLFPRTSIRRLGPAPADATATALDLTQGALGLALELDLADAVLVAPRRNRRELAVESVDRLLFTPTRPGALLTRAAARRIPVG
jgi:hypothetical protein